jgi:Na+/H+ antiporter NhaA
MLLFGFGFTLFLGIDKLYFDTNARLITERPEFYIALTLMLLGSQFFIAGFLGEMVLRNTRLTNRYTVKENI